MSETQHHPKIVILNNEIMPYRVPLFNQLAQRLSIKVFYSVQRSDERAWSLNNLRLNYPYEILNGFAIKIRKAAYGEWRRIWINPSLFAKLWREKPDAIIAYEYSLPAFTAYCYSKILGCAYLTWSEMTSHSSRTLSKGQRALRRLLLPHSAAVIGTSRAACEYFAEQGIEKARIFLAPQSLDVAWLEAEAKKNRKAHPPTLLYVGFLNERKGVKHLLAAFRLLLERMPEAILMLAGAGELRERLQAETRDLGDSLHFLGFIEPEKIPGIYAEADVFVLPSLEDTFGLVAAEAMASGLSLIVSPYAGISSHLRHDYNACIINPEVIEEMAESMEKLLRNPELRESFHENSQDFLQELRPEYGAGVFENAINFAMREKQ